MFRRIRDGITDYLQQADLLLLWLCCMSSGFEIALIYSATRYRGSNRSLYVQAAALGLGILAYILAARLNLEFIIEKWRWIAAFNVIFILLLLTPLGIGEEEVGNTAWIRIPGVPVNIGPAEVVKITYILLMAGQLDWLRSRDRELKSFTAAVFVCGHAVGLMLLYVAVSGDMGNALVFFFIFLCMAFAAGFALRWFVLLLAGAGGAAAAAWKLNLIPAYQKERFVVVFDHSYDPLGKGWHQTRSMLAIGSGGVSGQGYLNGTQTQSAY
ncbi:MAG: FtsW/RodA/SpoVE family cell cycle protein, partial [Oscillibacter sp.]|nr:FtsW/RodA/SpoVE family cell cycle protein [Oscillibacter sp.]